MELSMSNKEQLKEEFYKKISDDEGVSFVELSRINGFEGEFSYGIKDKNIIYWNNISVSAIDALEALIKEKKIEMKPCDRFLYLFDGVGVNLPTAKSDRNYKTARWLPVVFDPIK